MLKNMMMKRCDEFFNEIQQKASLKQHFSVCRYIVGLHGCRYMASCRVRNHCCVCFTPYIKESLKLKIGLFVVACRRCIAMSIEA